ncbi:hypothetical protein J6590_106646 [Homalodisca vitripennis]|nr:hypothetical protein J6590_106646 [Homalodisca vitripennis]
MEMAGVRGVALSWFRSFLTGREQRVRVGHAVSAPLPVTTGVPQGSMAGRAVSASNARQSTAHLSHYNLTQFQTADAISNLSSDT